MRNRLVHCLDALFVGLILGLLFVTFVHASPVKTGAPVVGCTLRR